MVLRTFTYMMAAVLALAGCAAGVEPEGGTVAAASTGMAIGEAAIAVEDRTQAKVGAVVEPTLREMLRLLATTEPGAWLSGRLGRAPIAFVLTDDFGVTMRVPGGTRTVEMNPEIFDRLPVETSAVVLAHELEHVTQNGLSFRSDIDGLAEFAALSVEYQVWRALAPADRDDSIEAKRLVAYAHFPSATLQAWKGSKFNWARSPLAPRDAWSAEARGYWDMILTRERAVREDGAEAPSERAWAAIEAYFQSLMRGDNWLEEGVSSAPLARSFVERLERLAASPAGTTADFAGTNEAEAFVLTWSFAGTFDGATGRFSITNPIRA